LYDGDGRCRNQWVKCLQHRQFKGLIEVDVKTIKSDIGGAGQLQTKRSILKGLVAI
jgi:hypothetical protein